MPLNAIFFLATRNEELHKVHTLPLDETRAVLGVVIYDAAFVLLKPYLGPLWPLI